MIASHSCVWKPRICSHLVWSGPNVQGRLHPEKKYMTKIKLVAGALIATAMLATPGAARESNLAQRHVTRETNLGAFNGFPSVDRRAGTPTQHVDSSETAPGGVCDFGDNPMIC